MKIAVNFLTPDNDWQDRVTQAAEVAADMMNSPEFLDRVASGPSFDNTDKTPQQVADDIRDADVSINVGFYDARLTRAIGYEDEKSHAVYFNRKKAPYGAGSPGNVAHEVMHVLGYQHVGNARTGNENTVPYRIGDWVDDNNGVGGGPEDYDPAPI